MPSCHLVFCQALASLLAQPIDILGLLRRPDGASLKELMKVTGWLAHSVRGFLSGTISRKTNILVPAKNKHGERR
jgi:Protein of unknown function (DUF3489)